MALSLADAVRIGFSATPAELNAEDVLGTVLPLAAARLRLAGKRPRGKSGRGILGGMPKAKRHAKSTKAADRAAFRHFPPGFPKMLPCLVCDKPKRSTWPGDRVHPACRKARAGIYMFGAELSRTSHHSRGGSE